MSVDVYSRAALTCFNLNRWVAVRSDTLGGIFAGAIAAYMVYGSGYNAGNIGFTLTVVLNFSQYILDCVSVFNLVEINGSFLITSTRANSNVNDF